MSDTLMTIIGIFVAVVIMFIFPLVEFTSQTDQIAQTVVETAVSDFVISATTKGEITQFDYETLEQKLYSTGNTYDIQIEAQIIDDNGRRVATAQDKKQLGENKYYSVYTNTILEQVEQDDGQGRYPLKKDDYLIVTVKNTNTTIGTQFKNILYKMIGKETYTIGTTSSGLVLSGNTGRPTIAVLEGEPPDVEPPEEPPENPPENPPPEEPPEQPPENPPNPPANEISVHVKEKQLKLENTDVILVLDASISMAARYQDMADTVKKNTANILKAIEAQGMVNSRITIIAFNSDYYYPIYEEMSWEDYMAVINAGPESDVYGNYNPYGKLGAQTLYVISKVEDIAPAINVIHAKYKPYNNTSYMRALEKIEEALKNPNCVVPGNKKMVIFQSDGGPTDEEFSMSASDQEKWWRYQYLDMLYDASWALNSGVRITEEEKDEYYDLDFYFYMPGQFLNRLLPTHYNNIKKRTKQICSDYGVEFYTIGTKIQTADGEQLLKDMAEQNNGYYQDADNTNLLSRFEKVFDVKVIDQTEQTINGYWPITNVDFEQGPLNVIAGGKQVSIVSIAVGEQNGIFVKQNGVESLSVQALGNLLGITNWVENDITVEYYPK